MLRELIQCASRHLETDTSFPAMACVVRGDGTVEHVPSAEVEGQASTVAAGQLGKQVKAMAQGGEIIAAAIAQHLLFRGLSEGDAIVIDLDHRDHEPQSYYLPFEQAGVDLRLMMLMRRGGASFAFGDAP